MLKLNIIGDFFSPQLNGLQFSQPIKDKLNSADLNVVNFEGPINTNKSVPICKSGPNITLLVQLRLYICT